VRPPGIGIEATGVQQQNCAISVHFCRREHAFSDVRTVLICVRYFVVCVPFYVSERVVRVNKCALFRSFLLLLLHQYFHFPFVFYGFDVVEKLLGLPQLVYTLSGENNCTVEYIVSGVAV